MKTISRSKSLNVLSVNFATCQSMSFKTISRHICLSKNYKKMTQMQIKERKLRLPRIWSAYKTLLSPYLINSQNKFTDKNSSKWMKINQTSRKVKKKNSAWYAVKSIKMRRRLKYFRVYTSFTRDVSRYGSSIKVNARIVAMK